MIDIKTLIMQSATKLFCWIVFAVRRVSYPLLPAIHIFLNFVMFPGCHYTVKECLGIIYFKEIVFFLFFSYILIYVCHHIFMNCLCSIIRYFVLNTVTHFFECPLQWCRVTRKTLCKFFLLFLLGHMSYAQCQHFTHKGASWNEGGVAAKVKFLIVFANWFKKLVAAATCSPWTSLICQSFCGPETEQLVCLLNGLGSL